METWIVNADLFLPGCSRKFNTCKKTDILFNHTHLSKDLLIDSEGEVQHVFNVVVLHPLQALVELLIQELQVTQVTWAAWAQAEVTQSLQRGNKVLMGCPTHKPWLILRGGG